MRSWVSPSLRWCTTRWPRERVDVLEPDGRVVGDQRRPVLGRGRARPARCRARSPAPAPLCSTRKTSSPPMHRVVEGVLQALACARLNTWKPASGSWESRKRYSEVILEPAAMITNRSLRLRPTPTKNRPSSSWWTSSSSAWVVPRRVPPDLVGAPGLVDGRVVEVLARRVPGGAADDADDLVGAVLAGGQVEDPDRVALVADHVGRVGEQGAVGADAGAAEREELVALGQRVEVEQQLLAGQRGLVGRGVLGGPRRGPVVGVGHRDPAAGAVLLALEGAAVVPVAAVAGRHRQVGLAGAGLDLVEDRLAQVGEVRGLLPGCSRSPPRGGPSPPACPWRAATRSRRPGSGRGARW